MIHLYANKHVRQRASARIVNWVAKAMAKPSFLALNFALSSERVLTVAMLRVTPSFLRADGPIGIIVPFILSWIGNDAIKSKAGEACDHLSVGCLASYSNSVGHLESLGSATTVFVPVETIFVCSDSSRTSATFVWVVTSREAFWLALIACNCFLFAANLLVFLLFTN